MTVSLDIWTSVLDIALAAAMLYYLYVWLVRTRSAAIVVGLLALGLVYLVANALGLHLTTGILQGFYAVALIAVIVIFQPELRRILENVSFLGGRTGQGAGDPSVSRMVAEQLFDLAEQRVGSLIILPGSGPVDRHLTAGIPLEGGASPQLLASLFDTHSPGHDGAVVLDGARVTHFGCYLPLSQQADLHARFGTRHRAALGISEVTDCLALIVSEESGEVSTASNGTITPQSTAAALEHTMEEFLRTTRPVARHAVRGWRRLVRRPAAKVGAVAAATALWFLTETPPVPAVHARVQSPILYENLADELYIASGAIESVHAELEGPPDSIAALQQEPPPLVVDLSEAGVGAYAAPVTDTQFRLPEDVQLVDAAPTSIALHIEQFRVTAVPVAPALTGEPHEDFLVAQVMVDPESVEVLHKADALVRDLQIATEAVDVSGLRKDLEVSVALVWPVGMRPVQPDIKDVRVLVRLSELVALPLATPEPPHP